MLFLDSKLFHQWSVLLLFFCSLLLIYIYITLNHLITSDKYTLTSIFFVMLRSFLFSDLSNLIKKKKKETINQFNYWFNQFNFYNQIQYFLYYVLLYSIFPILHSLLINLISVLHIFLQYSPKSLAYRSSNEQEEIGREKLVQRSVEQKEGKGKKRNWENRFVILFLSHEHSITR